MIKRIVFLVENRFNERDYERFGIGLLKKSSFQVEIWDVSNILHPHFLKIHKSSGTPHFEELALFYNKSDLYAKLSKLKNDDFVINLISYNFKTLKIYRALSASRADYAVFYANALPEPVLKKNKLCFISFIRWLAGFRHLKTFVRLLMNVNPRYLGVRPARLMLAGGEKCFNYRYPVDEHSEILWLHSLDYDLCLNERNNGGDEKNIAIFLDEFLPFHPDYMILGEKPPMGPERYYSLINSFFDIVEKETGLDVVIAAHPRSDYENMPDYFKGRRIIKGRTASLVKESKLVFSHCSTSLNFANFFYKPVVFLTCSDLRGTNQDNFIREMARWFGKDVINMDNCGNIDFKEELRVDKKSYDNYRYSYIKSKSSPNLPFWQIVADRFKKGLYKN